MQAIDALKAAGKEHIVIKVMLLLIFSCFYVKYSCFSSKASRDQREALYDMTNVSSIPSIWVKGTFVGGCNDGPEGWMGIKKMLKSGKLEEMLSAP